MRSARSSEAGKGNTGGVLIGYDIRRFWVVPALLALALFAACPVACLLIGRTAKARGEFILSMGENVYVVCMVLFFAFAVAAAVGVFSYLQRRSEANLIHALPVSRRRLFAVHYGTGLAMLFVPILLAGLAMMLFGAYPLMLVRWIGLSWLTGWVFYSIAVFAGMVSGNVFMHLFNYVFFMFLPAMILGLLSWFGEMMLYGYTAPDMVNKILTVITPPAALFGVPTPARLIFYLIAAAALTLLSWGVYRRRAVENTGDSLIFSWTRLAVVGVVTFLGALVMGGLFRAVSDVSEQADSRTALFAGMAFGFAAAFLVISLIVYRGRDIFRKKNLAAGAAALIAAALLVGGLAADITGYGKERFDPAAMDRAMVLSADSDSFLASSRFEPSCFVKEGGEKERIASPLWLKAPENIEAVCHMQNVLAQAGPQSPEEPEEGEGGPEEYADVRFYGTVELEGKRKDGGTIRRLYSSMNEELWEMIRPDLETIYQSDEFKDIFRLSHLRYAVKSMDASEYAKGDGSELGNMSLDKKQQEELIAALDRDFAAQTYGQYEEMEKISMAERPGERYYIISMELADDMDSGLSMTVTRASPAAWTWLEENYAAEK